MLGELVPKRLALQRTEAAAQLFAPPLSRIASFFRPVIWLLSKSTNGVVRLLGGDPSAGREPISDQELRGLVAAHESLTADERRLIDEVFAASERTVSEVMLPRTEVIFLEATMTVSRAAKLAGESPHSRYPVIGRSQDDVLGFVHIRDLVLGAPANGDRTTGPTAAAPSASWSARSSCCPGRRTCCRRCRRCAANGISWRSSSTNTAARTASSRSRT